MPVNYRQLCVDPHFRIFVMAVVAGFLALFGTPPDKQVQAMVLTGGIFALTSAWVAGNHYVQGKTVEGAVPPGMTPADRMTIQIGQAESAAPDLLHHAAEYLQTIEPGLSGQLKTVADRLASGANAAADEIAATEASAPIDTPPNGATMATTAPNTNPETLDPTLIVTDPAAAGVTGTPGHPAVPSATASVLIGMVLLALSMVHGCGPSPEFRIGAQTWMPDAASEYTAYVQADATLSAAQRTADLADAATVTSLGADPSSVQAVCSAWQKIEAPYLAYVDADPDLDADARALRHSCAATFDKLIHDESTRPFGQATQPATSP